MFIGAIADDLTGATDLALALSRGGLRVVQIVGEPRNGIDLADAEAVVVALKSRTIPAAQAVEQSLAAARALLAAGARQLFFKYCSTFDSTDDGNIGPVIDALLDLTGERRTIACPAFPANGRTVYKGHLFVGNALLSESSMRDHPLTPMRDPNLLRVLQRQTRHKVSLVPREIVTAGGGVLERTFDDLDGIAIVDAIDEADLVAIGHAARSLKLVTGGSGVALGLPANFRPAGSPPAPMRLKMAAPPGRQAVLAGSCSVATRGQIEAAAAAGLPMLKIDPLRIAGGEFAVDDALEFALRAQGVPVIYSSGDPAEVTAAQERLGRDKAGEVVEDFLGKTATRLREKGFSRFVVAGGETSGAITAALGVEALEIGPEIDAGVPWTLSRGDNRVALALKSGNFGARDFFTRAWTLLE